MSRRSRSPRDNSPRTDASSRAWTALLASAAALNLIAGVWWSLAPLRTQDLQRVVGWAGSWAAGGHPYGSPESETDYPPQALVLLAPLSALTTGALAPLWIIVNVMCAAWLIGRLAPWDREARRATVALVALMASAAAFRVLSQFSLAAFALGVAGMMARSHATGGLLLGLSLFKPQIGGVVLVTLLLRRARGDLPRVLIAVAVAGALLTLYAWRAGLALPTVLSDYVRVLGAVHGSTEPLPGHTNLTPWLARGFGPIVHSLGAQAATALVLLAPAVLVAARRPTWTRDRVLMLLAFCGVVSLLSFRHLSYDWLLALPALVAWRTAPFSRHRADAFTRACFWTAGAILLVQFPGVWRRVLEPAGAPPSLAWLTELDRVAAVGLWLALGALLARSDRTGAAS